MDEGNERGAPPSGRPQNEINALAKRRLVDGLDDRAKEEHGLEQLSDSPLPGNQASRFFPSLAKEKPFAVAVAGDEPAAAQDLAQSLRGRPADQLAAHLRDTRDVFAHLSKASRTPSAARALGSLERGYRLAASAAREKGLTVEPLKPPRTKSRDPRER